MKWYFLYSFFFFPKFDHICSCWRVNIRRNLSLLEVFHYLRSLPPSLSLSSLCTIDELLLTSMQIFLDSMESKIQSQLFFAGEVGTFKIYTMHVQSILCSTFWHSGWSLFAGIECWRGNWWFQFSGKGSYPWKESILRIFKFIEISYYKNNILGIVDACYTKQWQWRQTLKSINCNWTMCKRH